MPEIEIVLPPWLPGLGDKWGGGQSSEGGGVEASDPAAKRIIAAIQNASRRDVSSRVRKSWVSSCDCVEMVVMAAVLPPLRKSF